MPYQPTNYLTQSACTFDEAEFMHLHNMRAKLHEAARLETLNQHAAAQRQFAYALADEAAATEMRELNPRKRGIA